MNRRTKKQNSDKVRHQRNITAMKLEKMNVIGEKKLNQRTKKHSSGKIREQRNITAAKLENKEF